LENHAAGAEGMMLDWLTERASLTKRLQRCCLQFRVQRLHQKQVVCLPDEFAESGLLRAQKVMEREVILRCDGVAIVYAHTIVPLTASASEWPLFASLGENRWVRHYLMIHWCSVAHCNSPVCAVHIH